MEISQDTAVSFHYTLKLTDGDVADSSEGRDPMIYLHGHGNLVPGLESALLGKKAGDVFETTISAALGYGDRDDELVEVVPMDMFEGIDDLAPGMQFQINRPEGTQIITVAKIDGEDVTIDGNHPLAGEALHFHIDVTEVRGATQEELDHGHIHGPGCHHD